MDNEDFKYERFFELSGDLFCIAGYDGYFKKVNAAVSDLLGYTKEELYARPIDEFVFANDRNVTSKARQQIKKKHPLHHFDNRYLTKSGEIVWLSWTSMPVPEDELVFAIAKDVTHKKRLEMERADMLRKLNRLNDELKQLSLTTTHDLRAPVNNMLSLFSILDLEETDTELRRKMMESIKIAGNSLKNTLDSYVDILSSAVEQSPDITEVDVSPVINQVRQSIQALIDKKEVKISVDLSEAGSIRSNKKYLQSIVLNLLTNAIKYSKIDTRPVVEIHTEKHPDTVHLIVTDNGIGIDLKKAGGKMFSLHQQFHNDDSKIEKGQDSKGVGLYLVNQYMREMGGQIEVDSEPGEGTSFRLIFQQ